MTAMEYSIFGCLIALSLVAFGCVLSITIAGIKPSKKSLRRKSRKLRLVK